jgi:predicted alpha/beta-fold hydrolase
MIVHFYSLVLVQHLTNRHEEDSGLKAVITFSSPWDSFATSDSLERPVNWFLYNRYLTKVLIQFVERLMPNKDFEINLLL